MLQGPRSFRDPTRRYTDLAVQRLGLLYPSLTRQLIEQADAGEAVPRGEDVVIDESDPPFVMYDGDPTRLDPNDRSINGGHFEVVCCWKAYEMSEEFGTFALSLQPGTRWKFEFRTKKIIIPKSKTGFHVYLFNHDHQ